MGGKIYVLSVFNDDDICEPKVLGVYLHRVTACRKIIEEINKIEIYNENRQPSSPYQIMSKLRPYYHGKFNCKKGYKYDDYFRGIYWRLTKHHIKE